MREISTESGVKQSWSLKTLHWSHLKKGLEQQPRSWDWVGQRQMKKWRKGDER